MRRFGGLLLAAVMVLPMGLVASPAGAAVVLTCTKLTGTATFTPAVSPTVSVTHTVKSSSMLSGCTGTAGITSGVATFASTTIKENCAQLLANKKASTATVSVKWSNGKTSGPGPVTLTYVSTGVVKIVGKITMGSQFVGRTSSSEAFFLPKGGGCLTKGVSLSTTSVSFPKGQKLTIG